MGEEKAAAEPVAPAADDSARAIEGVVEQYRQAYEVRSLEALGLLYSQDLDLVVVFQGRAHRGWSQVEEFLAQRLEGATKVRMVIKDLSIQPLSPSSAVASATLESSIGDDAATVTERGTLTLVLRKVGEGWKLVSEHFSYPTGAS